MPRFSVTKRLSNAAVSHRLRNEYPGKCKNIHGHEYYYDVTLSCEILNKYGMVIDFGEIKRIFDNWIQQHWDHATVVSNNDTEFVKFLTENNQRCYIIDKDQTDETNTTAEWMSYYLFEKFKELLKDNGYEDVKLDEVKVWETATSYASYKG